uniref:Anaphase-promoting complex subunit 4 WD40 domain-containing protein n=1 Tax=Arcella intermedia TaxID=1963864 RepID=A0A6B2L8V5_9EUKA
MHCLFTHHKKAVSRVKFARDSKSIIAFASIDCNISVANVLELSQPNFTLLKGHKRAVSDFDWSSTNDFLLSASLDKTLCVWNTKTMKSIRNINTGSANLCCCFHPINNNVIVAGTSNSLVNLYNFSTGILICSIMTDAAAKCLSFSNDGMWLYAGCADGKVRWFRCGNPGLWTTFRFEGSSQVVNAGRAINSLTYRDFHATNSPSFPSLLINAVDSTARILRLNHEFEDERAIVPWSICPLVNKSYTVRSSFTPVLSSRKEGCFATGSEDGTVYIYDYAVLPPSGAPGFSKIVNVLQGHQNVVLDVSWNNEETLLASADAAGTVLVWKRVKDVQ